MGEAGVRSLFFLSLQRTQEHFDTKAASRKGIFLRRREGGAPKIVRKALMSTFVPRRTAILKQEQKAFRVEARLVACDQGTLTLILKGEVSVRLTSSSLPARASFFKSQLVLKQLIPNK